MSKNKFLIKVISKEASFFVAYYKYVVYDDHFHTFEIPPPNESASSFTYDNDPKRIITSYYTKIFTLPNLIAPGR